MKSFRSVVMPQLGESVTEGTVVRWYKQEGDLVARDEPLLEITIPTAYDPSLAPPGKHIMSIFAQYTPYHLKEGTWDDQARAAFVERAIDLIACYAPNIRSAIEGVHALSPLDLEREYGLTGGNIFHGDLRLDQLFALRPVFC